VRDLGGEPDVEMRAAARAKEVRFEVKPRVDVGAWADSPARADSGSERENLPDAVEEGVTYRDVAVRWWLAARLEDPELPDSD
jgi:hypothetical protein